MRLCTAPKSPSTQREPWAFLCQCIIQNRPMIVTIGRLLILELWLIGDMLIFLFLNCGSNEKDHESNDDIQKNVNSNANQGCRSKLRVSANEDEEDKIDHTHRQEVNNILTKRIELRIEDPIRKRNHDRDEKDQIHNG